MDNVITRSLLRSYHNKIKDKLAVATDPEIEAVIAQISFDNQATPVQSKLAVDSSRIERYPGGSANWKSYIYKVEPGDGVSYLYIPAGRPEDTNLFGDDGDNGTRIFDPNNSSLADIWLRDGSGFTQLFFRNTNSIRHASAVFINDLNVFLRYGTCTV